MERPPFRQTVSATISERPDEVVRYWVPIEDLIAAQAEIHRLDEYEEALEHIAQVCEQVGWLATDCVLRVLPKSMGYPAEHPNPRARVPGKLRSISSEEKQDHLPADVSH
jgi:hypothetical protein